MQALFAGCRAVLLRPLEVRHGVMNGRDLFAFCKCTMPHMGVGCLALLSA